MPIECTGVTENGVCESCKQAQAFADKLYVEMIKTLKASGLSDSQAIQAAVSAGLWSAETIIVDSNEPHELMEYVAGIGTEWFTGMEEQLSSRSSELKSAGSVANIMKNNGTVN